MKPARKPAAQPAEARVAVRTPNVPGYTGRVDRVKYEAMKKALLVVLPNHSPGLSQAEMIQAVQPHLPQDLFPGGAKSAWWAKCVQLDLEARGQVLREVTAKPLRWTRR
jgi:hypothetical protein